MVAWCFERVSNASLRLNIFRGMGFCSLEPLDESKLLVRNDTHPDVNVVGLTGNRVQDANKLWGLAT